jgi:hypothetical protein
MGSIVLDYPCEWNMLGVAMFTLDVPVELLKTAMEYRRN